MNSATEGIPWSYEKYRKHIEDVASPFICTIGNYRVATGGVDKTSCYKTLAGELI